MTLSIGGIGSGMDINGMVRALVTAERAGPEQRLKIREQNNSIELSGLGAMKSAVEKFQKSLEDLQDTEQFLTRKLTLSDSDYFSATASGNVPLTNFNIAVKQLATSFRAVTPGFDDGEGTMGSAVIGAGTLQLTVAGDSFDVVIPEDATSLADIRDAINSAEDNTGVQASLVRDTDGTRLMLTSTETGENQEITLTVTDNGGAAAGEGLEQLTAVALDVKDPGQDALLDIDGMTVQRSSNKIDDAIDGVTLDLKKAHSDTDSTSIEITEDKEAVKKTLEGFVNSYNTLMGVFDEWGSYDSEKGEAGFFQGDAMVRNMQSQLRRTMSSVVDDAPLLAEIGITTNQQGELEIDSSKLSDAMDNSLQEIANLFATPEQGLAFQMDEFLNDYTKTNGLFDVRIEGVEGKQRRVTDEFEVLDRRIEQYEARLMKQFTAMDMAVGQMYQSSSFLMQAMMQTPGQ